MLIEQAIFTSIQSHRFDDYRFATASPGVAMSDQDELRDWTPTYDSLLEQGDDAVSVNFHQLGSGTYCISKTSPSESEHGALRQVTTECLIVPPEVLEKFANNPLSVLAAAFAQGPLRLADKTTNVLEPFRLAGRPVAIDQTAIGRVLSGPGVLWLQAVVQAAIRWPRVAVAGPDRLRIIAGLINCLPVSLRPQFSFCTGLKPSDRYLFRVQSAGDHPARQRDLFQRQGVGLLDLSGKPPQELTGTRGYSGFVACAISTGKFGFLAQQLKLIDAGLSRDQLDVLGDELLESLACQASAEAAEPATTPSTIQPTVTGQGTLPGASIRCDAGSATSARAPEPRGVWSPQDEQIADPAMAQLMTFGLPRDPAQRLGRKCPEAVEKLEALDDAAFEAIAGKPGAFERFRDLWPQVLEKVGPELIEESREQYIRHALEIWKTCVEGDEVRDPAMAIRAIEVVNLLFEP